MNSSEQLCGGLNAKSAPDKWLRAPNGSGSVGPKYAERSKNTEKLRKVGYWCLENTHAHHRKPIPFKKHSCFSLIRPFINTSATWSPVGTYSSFKSPLTTLSRRKWSRTLICFVRAWYTVFCAIAMADWLSMRRWVGPAQGRPRSADKVCNQISSFVAWAPAIYSTSVLDRAVEPSSGKPPPCIKL